MLMVQPPLLYPQFHLLNLFISILIPIVHMYLRPADTGLALNHLTTYKH